MGWLGEEAKTKESARGGAWSFGRLSPERGQTASQPRKRPQGRSGQKPQEGHCRQAQRAASAPRPPKEIIEAVIAAIRARYGERAICIGDRGIRFVTAGGEGRTS